MILYPIDHPEKFEKFGMQPSRGVLFYGALARQGADRGVFITTSRFTPAAKDAANHFQGRIVLIDGIRLTSLMLRYGVGVEERQSFTVYSVNQDFFEE